jgi:hypothetical protein
VNCPVIRPPVFRIRARGERPGPVNRPVNAGVLAAAEG